MSLSTRSYSRVEALVLQCCFASVGTPVPPTVGEIVKFVNKWGEGKASAYQVENILATLVEKKCIDKSLVKHGKRSFSHYSITSAGTYYLLASVHFLPKQIMTAMSDLAHRVSFAASDMVNEYLSQGVKHG